MRNVPARINREAFDRVLQRAAEIQAHGRDIGEGLTEDEVLALGTEVGIPEVHLRQALLEEQTRVTMDDPGGMLDRMVAPATIASERVIQGTPESIAAALTHWLGRHEFFAVQRATPGRVVWEPISSFAGAMHKLKAAFDASRGKPFLDKVQLLNGVIVPLEDGFCHVTLVASLRSTRTGYVAGGAAMGATGTAAAGIAVILGAPLLLPAIVALPAFGAGWLITRSYRGVAERAKVGLLRALDELERKPLLADPAAPGSPRRTIARDIGETVREITREVRKAMEEKP